ncbi:hypothetical protein NOR_00139 [Metarhizium rileyi]|uniref:Uncharacterized protein n=1 Tax=Metarhizium rileyi (strain RCEF 4871) TaxID=1649241 RepID=A0A167KCM5_METRR|nr:hypothetical protein NOR_00139 [Metarhizium rileyi RCEF 4871]
MAECVHTAEYPSSPASAAIPSCREDDMLVAVAYSDTTEREPPVPMVPLKNPDRSSRSCSEEPPPISTPSSSSSVYAESTIPTVVDVPQCVEDHTCPPPSSIIEPMSASIYEVTWEEVFPVEEVMDEATGLPIYIAPWIIRSESDDDDNRRVADWTPASVLPLEKHQLVDDQATKKPLRRLKPGGNLGSVASQTPKKKRNFWMSFRRSKKAIAAAVSGSSYSLAPRDGNRRNSRDSSSTTKLECHASALTSKHTARESCEPVAVDSSAGKAEPPQSRPKTLVVSAAEAVKLTDVSITEIEVPTPPAVPKSEALKLVSYSERGHKIDLAIPGGELLSDELRVRFCC